MMWLRPLAAMAPLMFLVGCAQGGAPSSPTIQAGATQVAKAASPVAATVLASPAAASPRAASPVVASPAAASPLAGTAVAAAPVRITNVQVQPTDTTITLQNAGSTAVDLGGWKLQVGTNEATLPPNTRVAPGGTITIHTGSGTNTGNDVYLGQPAAALITGLQTSSRIALVDDRGTVVNEFNLPGR